MLTHRFESLFNWLARTYVQHDDTPRDVDHVIELAAARGDLEDARNEIAIERRTILSALAAPVRPASRSDEEAVSRVAMLNITTQR